MVLLREIQDELTLQSGMLQIVPNIKGMLRCINFEFSTGWS